ncbi:MAG: hypothetical protein U1A27_09155 [Phycisphaerae bacterium]
MNMMKRYWQILACGGVIVLSIGAGVWGYLQGESITARLDVPQKLMTKLKSLSTSGVNPGMIESERAKNEKAKAEYENALRIGRDLQVYSSYHETRSASGEIRRVERAPVAANVLPAPHSNSEAFAFRDAYRREHARLLTRMHAGLPPGAEEVALVQSEMRSAKTVTPQNEDPWSLSEGAVVVDTSSMLRNRPTSREDLLRQDAAFVAALRRAKQIWMYVEPTAIGIHALANGDDAPPADQIWQAQMSLWIQQDIATALTRVNEAAVESYAKAKLDDRAWVAYLPVKHLKRLSIRDRLGRGGGQNLNGVTWAESFTGKNNNASLFMVPVQLELVVDVRALPGLLTELARVNFYTPIGVMFDRVPPDLSQKPYVYGAAPVVRAVIDLEGYFFRDVFEKWIPSELKPVLSNPDAREPSRL